MDYFEWADEYDQNALRIKSVIEKKKGLLNKELTAEARQKLLDDITAYRRIYYDLTRIAGILRSRAEGTAHEA